jgi:hypothetical protein
MSLGTELGASLRAVDGTITVGRAADSGDGLENGVWVLGLTLWLRSVLGTRLKGRGGRLGAVEGLPFGIKLSVRLGTVLGIRTSVGMELGMGTKSLIGADGIDTGLSLPSASKLGVCCEGGEIVSLREGDGMVLGSKVGTLVGDGNELGSSDGTNESGRLELGSIVNESSKVLGASDWNWLLEATDGRLVDPLDVG